MQGPTTRTVILLLLLGSLWFTSTASAGPGRQSGPDERGHIVAAQQELARKFGGRKLNQTWRNGELLIVWQTAKGRRLLVEVDPGQGGWKILRNEDPRR